MIVPGHNCNNLVVFVGKASGYHAGYRKSDGDYFTLSNDGTDLQCILLSKLDCDESINGKRLRVKGEIKTDKHGDMYLLVNAYRHINNKGFNRKNKGFDKKNE